MDSMVVVVLLHCDFSLQPDNFCNIPLFLRTCAATDDQLANLRFEKRDSLGSSVIEMGVPTELNTLGDEDDSEKQHGMTNEVEALRDVFY